MKNKYPILFIIMVGFIAQLFLRGWVVLTYSIYKDELASLVCENRFSQNTHCKGKCYLNKQIETQQAVHSNIKTFTLSKIKIDLFTYEFKIIRLNHLVFAEILKKYFLYLSQENAGFKTKYLIPPELLKNYI